MSDTENYEVDTLSRVQEQIISALQLARVRKKMFNVEPTWPTIERYTIRELIGEGGMGAVFLAHDPKLDRDVAIKLLNAEHGRAMQDRLLREAQAMARVPHNHVVRVHDVVIEQGVLCLVMEYIQGTTLREWQADRTVDEILDAYAQAGRGLAQIHSAGLVHRDFKPDNVFVEESGRVVVGDLGLAAVASVAAGAGSAARASDSMLDRKMTRTGTAMGTPGYMSPAQLLGRKVDARSDQFSFCVALYEAVYNEHPFAGDTREDIAAAVVRGRTRPRPESKGAPAWLHAFLTRGLLPEPDERYADMDDLLRQLARRRGRKKRITITSLAAAALIAMTVLGYSMAPGAEDPCENTDVPEIWNEELRTRIEANITRDGSERAMRAWTRMAGAFDSMAERWRKENQHVCRKERQDGMDRVVWNSDRCLRYVAGRLRALGNRLADAEDLDLKQVYDIASDFDREDACAHLELIPLASEPPDEIERPKVEAIDGLINEAYGLERVGKYSEAEAIANQAVNHAETLNYLPVRARARYRLGHILGSQSRGTDAERELQRAAELAYATLDVVLAAEIEIFRAKVAAADLFDAQQASELSVLARNALLQSGHAPIPGIETADNEQRRFNPRFADYLEARGLAALRDRKAGDAVDRHRETLEIRRQLAKDKGNDAELDVSKSLNNLANALIARGKKGDREEALALYKEAIAMREQLLSSEHPLLAEPLFNLGDELRKQGELDAARPWIEQAWEIESEEYGPSNNESLLTLVALADLEIKALKQNGGDKEQARKVCDRIKGIHDELAPERRKEMQRVSEHMLLADCYRLGALNDEAESKNNQAILAQYESAADIARSHAANAGGIAELYMDLLCELDEIYVANGQPERAYARWQEAISVLESGDKAQLDRARKNQRERCEPR